MNIGWHTSLASLWCTKVYWRLQQYEFLTELEDSIAKMSLDERGYELKNLIKGVSERIDHVWSLTSRGDSVAPEQALLTADSTLQPLVAYTKPDADGAKDEKGNLLVKRTWYCLLATTISFNVPQGYHAGDDSISVRKGRVRVSITAQHEGIGNAKTNERSATWRVVGNDHSPKNTAASKSVYVDAGCSPDDLANPMTILTSDRSNSVSTDIGANVGFFGETRK